MTTIKAAILAAMFASTAGVACANPLDAERGQTRPLIIVAPDAGSVAITALTAALALPHTQAGFADRQVVVFTVVAGTGKRDGATLSAAATGALLNALGLRADGPTTVVLVGKDGGLKLRSAQLDLAEILRTIDAMPMRRAETRQR